MAMLFAISCNLCNDVGEVIANSLSSAGYTYFDAYPKPFAGFAKGLQWSWIQE